METSWKPRYRRAVELLLERRPGDAIGLLEGLDALAGEGFPAEGHLALGKAYFEVGEGSRARRCFEEARRNSDPEDAPYLDLLIAAAAAQAGEPDEALRLLEGMAERDPRFEHAARTLARAITAGDPPLLRF